MFLYVPFKSLGKILKASLYYSTVRHAFRVYSGLASSKGDLD